MHQLFQWTRQHEALADDLVADYRREAAILKRVGQSDTALLSRMFTDISRRLDGGVGVLPEKTGAQVKLPATEGFDLFKDSFYHRLENRWRGAPEEIARRLRIYIPDVEAAWLRTGEKPVMDLGCGRGEWLGLLRDYGLSGFGIDTNAVQIEEAQEAGLDVRRGDALQALADQPDASLSALTAHHLIEHLPFDAVAWIVREAGRVLAPGGILLFETPNTRNVLVGATTFHTDPTHLKPMPEQVMGVLLETAGFDPVDIRHINPHERLGEFLDMPDFHDELAHLMFGPQDLAILGMRPKDV
jgi:O-antigen chain-terminating methyltransferase